MVFVVLAFIFALPSLYFFAQLSFLYGKFFDSFPQQAELYQREFAKSVSESGHSEVAYRPFRQIKMLKELKLKFKDDKNFQSLADTIVKNLIFTCALFGIVIFFVLTFIFTRV